MTRRCWVCLRQEVQPDDHCRKCGAWNDPARSSQGAGSSDDGAMRTPCRRAQNTPARGGLACGDIAGDSSLLNFPGWSRLAGAFEPLSGGVTPCADRCAGSNLRVETSRLLSAAAWKADTLEVDGWEKSPLSTQPPSATPKAGRSGFMEDAFRRMPSRSRSSDRPALFSLPRALSATARNSLGLRAGGFSAGV